MLVNTSALGVRARCAIALLGAFAVLAAPAVAQAPPPDNDDYLQSLRLEDAGHRTPRSPLFDVKDTTAATVQADLLAPRASGGGAEPTNCDGVEYGRTIWYDITPDEYGAIQLQSAGRDGVISVFEWDPRTVRLGKLIRCVNEPGLQDELDVYLEKGKAYTVQLGGVGSGDAATGGQVQFTERFFEDADRDRVLDVSDRCVGTQGTKKLKGCLPEVDVTPVLVLSPAAGGVRVKSLTVTDSTSKGGKVAVTCCGNRRIVRRLKHRRADFTKDFAKPLPFGAKLTLSVTRAGAVGQRFVWPLARKQVGKRETTCLVPATGKPPRRGGKCQ